MLDVFVLIGGWGMGNSNPALPPTASDSGTADLFRRVQSGEIDVGPNHEKRVLGLRGTLGDEDVGAALTFIKENFDPRGKLIVYGHSMGGAAALRLCRKISAEAGYFDSSTGALTSRVIEEGSATKASGPSPTPLFGLPTPHVSGTRLANSRVRVDLLLTVDAARGPRSESLERTVGGCVRTNINYYQTNPHGHEKSFGGPNLAMHGAGTIVWNHDVTGATLPNPDQSKPDYVTSHIDIDEQTNNICIDIIRQALTVQQVTDFWGIAGR